MTRALGVDLGTRSATLAAIDEAGRAMALTPRPGEQRTACAVRFDDAGPVVGSPALAAPAVGADRRLVGFALDFGREVCARSVRGRHLPPEAVAACLVREWKEALAGNEELAVVVAVPAGYDDAQRQAVRDAFAIAGVRLLEVISAPAAVALSLAESLPLDSALPSTALAAMGSGSAGSGGERSVTVPETPPEFGPAADSEPLPGFSAEGAAAVADVDSKEPLETLGGAESASVVGGERVLICHWEAAAFEAALVEISPRAVRTLAVESDSTLGVGVWIERVADELADHYFREHRLDLRDHPLHADRLTALAEQAFAALETEIQTTVRVAYGGLACDVRLTRSRVEELAAPLAERIVLALGELQHAAGQYLSDVARTVLSGGGGRTPLLAALVKRAVGRGGEISPAADGALACGAACRAADLLAGRSAERRVALYDVRAHGFGVESADPSTGERRQYRLVRRNASLPASVVREFTTRVAGQRALVIRAWSGNSPWLEDCRPAGLFLARELPSGLPQGARLTVSFACDEAGLWAAALESSSGGPPIALDRRLGLSADRLARWRAVLEGSRAWTEWEQAADAEFTASAVDAPVRAAPEIRGDIVPTEADAEWSAAADSSAEPVQDVFSDAPPAHAASGNEQPLFNAGSMRRRRRRGVPLWANALGFLLFSGLGLAIGYYILCWLRPETGNFLHLDLPFLPKP